MTPDERLLVEWVVWNVRTGDLPHPIRDAALRVSRTASYPRPDGRRQYGPLTVHVAAFPHDENLPHPDKWCSRIGVGATVDKLLTDDMAYVLVHQGRPSQSG